jgi:hypothetical protein
MKSQTATEYLIIVAVVIIIALIVVTTLGNVTSIGNQNDAILKYSSRTPIAITSWTSSTDVTSITLTNTGNTPVQLNSFVTSCINRTFNRVLSVGGSVTTKFPGNYPLSSTGFLVQYQRDGFAYTLASDAMLGSCAGLLTRLTGYWDGTYQAYDSSPWQNHGILINRTTVSPNGEFSFGDTSYILIPHHPSLAPPNLTISLWSSFGNWSTLGGLQRFLSKTEGGGYSFIFNDFGANQLFFTVRINSTTYIAASDIYTNLSIGWHHFAGTYDGRNVKYYLDGNLISTAQTNISSTIYYGVDNSLILGAEAEGYYATTSGSWPVYNGTEKSILIYNRSLSDSEVLSLYRAGR